MTTFFTKLLPLSSSPSPLAETFALVHESFCLGLKRLLPEFGLETNAGVVWDGSLGIVFWDGFGDIEELSACSDMSGDDA